MGNNAPVCVALFPKLVHSSLTALYSKDMRVTVVCGLLGAGKTTFIQRFLKGAGRETVVLVNDFGKAGIDGEIISSGGIESIELPSGCVCCTLKFDLISTIQHVISTLKPEHLVVEPSGVATVSGILEVFDILKLRQVTVVGIVDAAEFVELYESGMFGSYFEDQIRNSDVILINKTDLVDASLADKTAALIERLNPGALTYRTVKAGLDAPLPDVQRGAIFRAETPFHCRYDTLSMPLRDMPDAAVVRDFFHDMGKGVYGTIVRAKALIQTDGGPYKFDLSFGKVDSAPFDAPVAKGRLVVIGEGLKKDAIAKHLGAPNLLL